MMGIPAEELPRLSLLPAEAANVAVLFDPIQNPMAFLVLSLGFGAVHLIAGMAVTHDYPMFKNIITILGTIIAMACIIFIALLFSMLLSKLLSLVTNIVTEIQYRA